MRLCQPYKRPKYCKGMKMERLRRVFKTISLEWIIYTLHHFENHPKKLQWLQWNPNCSKYNWMRAFRNTEIPINHCWISQRKKISYSVWWCHRFNQYWAVLYSLCFSVYEHRSLTNSQIQEYFHFKSLSEVTVVHAELQLRNTESVCETFWNEF